METTLAPLGRCVKPFIPSTSRQPCLVLLTCARSSYARHASEPHDHSGCDVRHTFMIGVHRSLLSVPDSLLTELLCCASHRLALRTGSAGQRERDSRREQPNRHWSMRPLRLYSCTSGRFRLRRVKDDLVPTIGT